MEYLEEVQLSLEQLGDGDLDALRGIRVRPAARPRTAHRRRPRIIFRHAAGLTPSRAHASILAHHHHRSVLTAIVTVHEQDAFASNDMPSLNGVCWLHPLSV